MKTLKYFFLLLILAGCSGVSVNDPGIRVTMLTCDHVKNPIGIDNLNPSFSWQITDTTKGRLQSAFRIYVSSSEKLSGQGNGDIWDSGKIKDDQSVNIPYRGKPLESGKRYYWKVSVWNRAGKDPVSSETAFFEMGLLNEKDWVAKWISAPTLFDWSRNDRHRKVLPKNAPPEMEQPAPVFLKKFNLEKDISSARAYITGLGFFELYVNGTKTGQNLMDPAFTDYTKTVLYLTFDITGMLRKGENILDVMLGNGWYNMFSRDVWSFDYAPWRDKPVLLCQVKVKYADGTGEIVASDLSWKSHPGPVIFNSIRQGETYNALSEREGCHKLADDNKKWYGVREARKPLGTLKAQVMPSVKIDKELNPVSIRKIRNGRYLVDFGQAMSGFVKLKVTGKPGTKITLKYGELLDKNGSLDQRNISQFVALEPFQTDTYTLNGNKNGEEFHPRFSYHGFRYVEVDSFPGELKPQNLVACSIHTAFDKAGTFECSNETLNKINQNTLWSFISNYEGYPTDCPHREKNGWTGDAQLASETGLYNFDMNTSYSKWMDDLIDAQLENGMLPGIAPTAGWGYYWGNGPAWDHALFAIPWNTWLYTGDRSLLVKAYPAMKKYMGFIRTKSEGHLVSWGLGDWCPARTTTPEVITSTGYYYADAKIIAKTASLLGFAGEAEFFSKLSDSIRTAFHTKLYDIQTGVVGNGSQTAQSAALYFGLLEESDTEKALAKLLENLNSSDLNIDVGILGAKYMLNVLAKEGRTDVAYQHIISAKYPGWANWVENGATTLWETWNGDASRIHIMYGDISAWFYKNLVGIKVDENAPGFKHFFIDPYIPGNLQWVKGTHDSPYGTIRSEWEKKKDGVGFRVIVPNNSSAAMYFPVDDSSKILLNGKPVKNSELLTIGKIKSGKIFIELGPGEYRFNVLK
jgi:alpha-L-rhamnosidase